MTNNRFPAFTLIEMIVVLGVIGIMTAMIYPMYSKSTDWIKATKDLNNLRQIAMATQLYMNDNNGVFPGSATVTWMSQLALNQKYLRTWRVVESPFDKRTTSELGDESTAVSYGINANILPGNVAISDDKITKPVTFIVFAPAQAPEPAQAPWTATVTFRGTAHDPPPGVTVVDDRPYPPPSPSPSPTPTVKGGTHGGRTKINAVFADWHVEAMDWNAFKMDPSWSP
jgi:prepilin-type N-terminal cleavage/methylation domain-containing protein/prepilin-type processing-associated H-X9-DG protein